MFKKYPSLTNHYMSKEIERFKEIYEDKLEQTNWIVQEKLHGANISLLFTVDESPTIFSRNQKVSESFYGATDVFHSVIDKMTSIQEWVDNIGYSVRIFGELFGGNVQKGVDYGPTKQILFYDIQVDDIQKSQLYFDLFFVALKLEYLMVPSYGIFPSLESALKYNILRDSVLLDKKNNLIEGVTIKPYELVLSDHNGSLFYLKKKNDKFKEKQKVRKVRTETQYTEEVNEWKNTFLSYIHDERVESVYSKEGRIDSFKSLSKYIPLIHLDAIETFKKEEPDFIEEKFTKNERKYIFNSSKYIVAILKKELMG